MARAHGISTLFSASALLLAACATLAAGSIVIATQYAEFRRNAQQYEHESLQRQREMLGREMEHVLDIVAFERLAIQENLKKDLRDKTAQAHAVASGIHSVNRGRMAEQEVKELVIEALDGVSFYDGRGYFWIHDTDYNLVMNPFRPGMAGKNDFSLTDLSGKKIVQSFVRIAQEKGEGFDTYYWNKPGQSILMPKIAHLRLFEPYGWVIGTGEYLEDMELRAQSDIKRRLELFRPSTPCAVRIVDFNGTVLFDPSSVFAVGENILEVKDASGEPVVLRILDEGLKAEGGYGEINLPLAQGGTPAQSIFYARTVLGWGWIVVASAPLQGVSEVVFERRGSLRATMIRQVTLILGALAAVSGAVILVSAMVSRRVRGEFTVFGDFFRNVARGGEPIDAGKLRIRELRALAGAANDMRADLNAYRDELMDKSRMLEAEVEERSRAQTEALKARNAFQAILDSMPSVVVAVDSKALVTHWNLTAQTVTGVAPEKAVGMPVDQVFPGMGARMDAVSESLGSGVPVTRGKEQFVLGGQPRVIDMLVYPLKDGRAYGAVIRLDDVTEKTGLEEMLVQTEKVMSLGGLAAGMAHEINNPLGGILQSAQVLKRRLDPETPATAQAARDAGCEPAALGRILEARSVPELLEGIRQSAQRAARIVANMLEFSRKSDTRMQPAALSVLMDKAVELCLEDYDLKKRYDFRKIAVERDYDQALPQVPCLATQIEQVLVNLIRNAAHAFAAQGMDGSARITLRTRLEAGYARMEVEDNGPGMDEATRRRIFEPFFSTKPPGEGTGLGLSVSFFIITSNHGGTIHVESEPGKGTRFVIKLPLGERE